MSIELQMLVFIVALAIVQMLVAAVGAMGQVGLSTLAGNRERVPELTGWAGRAVRAHRNLLESLALFAALVLVAEAAGRTGPLTALGAQLFFWARLVYAGVYIAGVPWVRTLVWLAAMVGLLMILWALLPIG